MCVFALDMVCNYISYTVCVTLGMDTSAAKHDCDLLSVPRDKAHKGNGSIQILGMFQYKLIVAICWMFECVIFSPLIMQMVYKFKYEGISVDQFDDPTLPLPRESHWAQTDVHTSVLCAGLDTGGALSVWQECTTQSLTVYYSVPLFSLLCSPALPRSISPYTITSSKPNSDHFLR